jgi:gluconokinase
MASSSPVVVVMGVSGCGKSTVGQLLARSLGFDFAEGDDFHPPGNVAKMKSGVALVDADRQDWLAALAERIGQSRAQGRGLVLSCSALKRSYRDRLRTAAPDLHLVHLVGDFAQLRQRMAGRTDHYMPPSLLESQFRDLQPPGADEKALELAVSLTPAALVQAILAVGSLSPLATPSP